MKNKKKAAKKKTIKKIAAKTKPKSSSRAALVGTPNFAEAFKKRFLAMARRLVASYRKDPDALAYGSIKLTSFPFKAYITVVVSREDNVVPTERV